MRNNNHVKFVSYTGNYPNLCRGDLTLEIDGEIGTGEWEIDVDRLPEKFRRYAREIGQVFNENVEYGCCGGCI